MNKAPSILRRNTWIGMLVVCLFFVSAPKVGAFLAPTTTTRIPSIRLLGLSAFTTMKQSSPTRDHDPSLHQSNPNPLFKGPSTTGSMKPPTKTPLLGNLFRRLRIAILMTTVAAVAFSKRTWALATMQNSPLSTIRWKPIAKALLGIWCVTVALSTWQVKQRQAKIATSEWSRYARYPAARGRAILWVMSQQVLMVLASKLVLLGPNRKTAIRKLAGKHFADSLLKLGPLYIKLGQIVSCRKNLLGPEWIDAMATLQDKVPANTGQEALDLAYTTLEGGKQEFEQIFVEFDPTPLAAASLGQVHKAKLRSNGDVVAVKIQRPNLRKIYDQDMKFLTTIAQWMDKMPSSSKNVGGIASSWTKIFEDAEVILYREIDYRDEASNGVRFAHDFGLTRGGLSIPSTAKSRNNQTLPSAADWIRVPYVYQNISNERLLVMEYVPSIKVTNTEKLKAASVTATDQINLADALARAYLRQFCCNLFFSTDPHPGNVGVEIMPNGKPRLVLYDFGQAATLTQDQADGILQIIEAIIDMNVDRSIEAFHKMGVLVDGADLNKVREKVAENYRTGKVKANRRALRRKGYQFKDDDEKKEETTNTTAIATNSTKESKVKDAEVMSFFSLPAEYAFVARAISQMDGVGKGLDPEFDFISNSAPYIVEIKGADKYLREEIVKFFKDVPKRIAVWQTKTLPDLYETRLAEWSSQANS